MGTCAHCGKSSSDVAAVVFYTAKDLGKSTTQLSENVKITRHDYLDVCRHETALCKRCRQRERYLPRVCGVMSFVLPGLALGLVIKFSLPFVTAALVVIAVFIAALWAGSVIYRPLKPHKQALANRRAQDQKATWVTLSAEEYSKLKDTTTYV